MTRHAIVILDTVDSAVEVVQKLNSTVTTVCHAEPFGEFVVKLRGEMFAVLQVVHDEWFTGDTWESMMELLAGNESFRVF